ncbi:E4 ORF1 [Simian adenovirus ch1]|nr:E4 ORF1 [Simian adenovirus ch1]
MAVLEAVYVYFEGPGAMLPEQEGYSNAYVLFSPADFVIPPRGVVLLYLHIAVTIPPGYVGTLFSLSDMNARGFFVGAQTLHPGSRVELSVLLFNHSDVFCDVRAKQPVARLLLERVVFPPIRQASLL